MKENRVKLLFIIPSLRPGGAERITSILCQKLDKSIFEVNLIVLNSKDSFYKFKESDEINIIDLNISKVRFSIFKIKKNIDILKPNIVFSSITHLNTYLGLLKPFFFPNIKLVLRETNVMNSILIDPMSFSFKKYFQKIAYKNADKIICQSGFMKLDILETLGVPEDNLMVINNPVRIPKQEINENKEYDLITIGRFSKTKNYNKMIEVISKLDYNIKLFIIGDGGERKNIEGLIYKYNLENRVTLAGVKNDPLKYLKKAKLFVLTSNFDSFPNVVLEAGSIGLPVISFDMPGGIKEIIVNDFNGILVENGDVEKMAHQINKYINYSFNRKDIIKYTRSKFDVGIVIKKYEKVFIDLMTQSNYI